MCVCVCVVGVVGVCVCVCCGYVCVCCGCGCDPGNAQRSRLPNTPLTLCPLRLTLVQPSTHLSKSVLHLKEGLSRTSLPLESTCSRVRFASASVGSPRSHLFISHSSESELESESETGCEAAGRGGAAERGLTAVSTTTPPRTASSPTTTSSVALLNELSCSFQEEHRRRSPSPSRVTTSNSTTS
jgi:hypothetical protein